MKAAISINTQSPAISSLEIAELTGKRHDHVMRDIEVTLKEAGIDIPKFGGIYKDARNRNQNCYYLPRFECDLVVSGYSVPYRAAIIRRWHELENSSRKIADESEHATWLIRQMLKLMPADKLIPLILPLHTYGSLAPNGKQRHGFRRPAFITQKHRRKEAREIHERGIVLKYLAQNLQLGEGEA